MRRDSRLKPLLALLCLLCLDFEAAVLASSLLWSLLLFHVSSLLHGLLLFLVIEAVPRRILRLLLLSFDVDALLVSTLLI